MRSLIGSALLGALLSSPALASAQQIAATAVAEPSRIRDNLFLLEEAYNQEPGVIQHVSLFQYQPRAGGWTTSFTEEWPVPTDLNQLSVTLNMGKAGDGSPFGLSDMVASYRIQAMGLGGKGAVAMAPRLSLVLPTGSSEDATGRGVFGLQVNLPVSLELGRFFVLHLNAGTTLTPGAQSPGGRTDTAVDVNAGFAVVWQPLEWLNALVETSYTTVQEVGDRQTERIHSLVVNPGLRFAIDHHGSSLQVVPGISAPMQVLPGTGFEAGVLTYLSFEHPAF